MSFIREQIIRLYDTVFDRAPDAAGQAFWEDVATAGHGLDYIAERFMVAPEFAAVHGQPDNLSFVHAMYENILDRAGEAEGVAFWTSALNEGRADRAHVVVRFSESPEHIAQIDRQYAPPPTPPGDVVARPPSVPRLEGPAHTTGSGFDNDLRGFTEQENIIFGDDGNDTLRGGEKDDTLNGGAGNDVLHGNGGDDVLIGGPGRDFMVGGAGNDVFRFDAVADMDGDLIAAFHNGDDALDFRGLGLTYRGAGAFFADGTAQIRHEQYVITEGVHRGYRGDTTVYVDTDGNGTADASMTIGSASVAAGDFLL